MYLSLETVIELCVCGWVGGGGEGGPSNYNLSKY